VSRQPNDTPSEEMMAMALYSAVRHSIKALINGEFFALLKLLSGLFHPHPNRPFLLELIHSEHFEFKIRFSVESDTIFPHTPTWCHH
jgi:hypothetical protein